MQTPANGQVSYRVAGKVIKREQQLSDWAQQTPRCSVRTWQTPQRTVPG